MRKRRRQSGAEPEQQTTVSEASLYRRQPDGGVEYVGDPKNYSQAMADAAALNLELGSTIPGETEDLSLETARAKAAAPNLEFGSETKED